MEKVLMKTPYYEIDEAKLNADIGGLQRALSAGWGTNSIAACSVKTNSLPWLLNHFREHGFYAEVVSTEEYDLVRRIGFAPAKIIYNGPIKDRDLFFRVLQDGGRLNLDSSQEIYWLEEAADRSFNAVGSGAGTLSADMEDDAVEKKQSSERDAVSSGILRLNCSHQNAEGWKVGLRVNVDFHRLVPDEVPADAEGSRFGYSEENGELEKVIRRLQALPHVRIAGLHLHSSTKSRSVKAYAAVADFAGRIASKYGLIDEIEYIDMGGGFYGGVPGKPTFDDYLPAIAGGLNRYFNPERVSLILEPGVSMVSSSFSFVTSVRDIKHIGDHVYAVIDGSRLDLNPQVTRRWYPHHIQYGENVPGFGEPEADQRQNLPSQWIAGATCMEYDRLFEIKDEPALRVGDRVVFDLAGGYTICLTPLFIHYFPAVYVKKEDGSVFTAREPWTNEEFLQKNSWET